MKPTSPVSLLDPGGEWNGPNRPARATTDSPPSWESKAPHPHPETAQAESSASSEYPKANKGSQDSTQYSTDPFPPKPLHISPQWVPICSAAPKVFPGRVIHFHFQDLLSQRNCKLYSNLPGTVQESSSGLQNHNPEVELLLWSLLPLPCVTICRWFM